MSLLMLHRHNIQLCASNYIDNSFKKKKKKQHMAVMVWCSHTFGHTAYHILIIIISYRNKINADKQTKYLPMSEKRYGKGTNMEL